LNLIFSAIDLPVLSAFGEFQKLPFIYYILVSSIQCYA